MILGTKSRSVSCRAAKGCTSSTTLPDQGGQIEYLPLQLGRAGEQPQIGNHLVNPHGLGVHQGQVAAAFRVGFVSQEKLCPPGNDGQRIVESRGLRRRQTRPLPRSSRPRPPRQAIVPRPIALPVSPSKPSASGLPDGCQPNGLRLPGRAANMRARRLAYQVASYSKAQAKHLYYGRLAPRPRRQPDRNAGTQAISAGESPIARSRSASERPATGPDLEAAQEDGPADLHLPHARRPTRPATSDTTTATATRAAISSLIVTSDLSRAFSIPLEPRKPMLC